MSQKAIIVDPQGTGRLVTDAPIPRLRDDYILAETRAIALNPTDYHHMTMLSEPGATLGCDWSGVILETGKNITRFKPGEEVFGVCHGGNNDEHEDGAFAQVVACKEIATIHKPKGLSFEEAATFGAGLATCAQVLYYCMRLPFPSPGEIEQTSREAMLVYGGSSATGTLLIQLATLSGFRVYTTCSASNFDLVKSRGADYAFDYNDASCETQLSETIRTNGDSFKYIVDCIGHDETASFCAKFISTEGRGGHYHSVKAPLPEVFKKLRPEANVQATTALAYTLLGEEFHLPGMPPFPADLEQAAFAKQWQNVAEPLVLKGLLKPHPPLVLQGGLEAVPTAIVDVGQGKVRAKKAVFSLQ
ncbi:uncharacterized protein Z518_00399 [Rhinocladiella mackenziei CBS 650.93]|uniref:Enoyl reductase (ER) domain-containing protein n=1 Tax=Rhinocladiella mackenziei CBS 650.93 TaxID=1442369 RepID=A0A0D2JIR3_9EURO|nr:uncharacterized protein Z518_00399 [Rhinocladiella mackenziei CBS 650.93]KIX09320.1 hypothetical protein Z518_00399 [Rhinocladiella mackenziei CBS 650.93]